MIQAGGQRTEAAFIQSQGAEELLHLRLDAVDHDEILEVLPGGVSGRQFTGHYRDQVEPFMKGEKRYWWFSDREIANHAKTEQKLVPP